MSENLTPKAFERLVVRQREQFLNSLSEICFSFYILCKDNQWTNLGVWLDLFESSMKLTLQSGKSSQTITPIIREFSLMFLPEMAYYKPYVCTGLLLYSNTLEHATSYSINFQDFMKSKGYDQYIKGDYNNTLDFYTTNTITPLDSIMAYNNIAVLVFNQKKNLW